MDASRLFAFVGVIVIAMLAVQADAALTFDASSDALSLLQPSLPVLFGLASLIALAVSVSGQRQPVPRRRRVNRARMKARRASA
jgi:hypothetical protein